MRKYISESTLFVENDLENGLIETIARSHDTNYLMAVYTKTKDGDLEGVKIEWWPNGKIKRLANFVNGEITGEDRYFFSYGKYMLSNYYTGKEQVDSREIAPMIEHRSNPSKQERLDVKLRYGVVLW